MKQIICTNRKNYALTVDREYTTIQEDDNASIYTIVNDRGLTRNYTSSLFRDAVIPPVRLTDQEIINSITLNGLIVTYRIFDNETISFNIGSVSIAGSVISCGVQQIYGINSFIQTIITNLPGTLNNDFRKEFFKRIFLSHIGNILSQCRFYILSTASQDISNPIIIEALNELSISTNDGINPNSGNNIILWVMDSGHEYNSDDDEFVEDEDED